MLYFLNCVVRWTRSMGPHLQTNSGTREVKQCWQMDNNYIWEHLKGRGYFLPSLFTSDIIKMQEIFEIRRRMQWDLKKLTEFVCENVKRVSDGDYPDCGKSRVDSSLRDPHEMPDPSVPTQSPLCSYPPGYRHCDPPALSLHPFAHHLHPERRRCACSIVGAWREAASR